MTQAGKVQQADDIEVVRCWACERDLVSNSSRKCSSCGTYQYGDALGIPANTIRAVVTMGPFVAVVTGLIAIFVAGRSAWTASASFIEANRKIASAVEKAASFQNQFLWNFKVNERQVLGGEHSTTVAFALRPEASPTSISISSEAGEIQVPRSGVYAIGVCVRTESRDPSVSFPEATKVYFETASKGGGDAADSSSSEGEQEANAKRKWTGKLVSITRNLADNSGNITTVLREGDWIRFRVTVQCPQGAEPSDFQISDDSAGTYAYLHLVQSEND